AAPRAPRRRPDGLRRHGHAGADPAAAHADRAQTVGRPENGRGGAPEGSRRQGRGPAGRRPEGSDQADPLPDEPRRPAPPPAPRAPRPGKRAVPRTAAARRWLPLAASAAIRSSGPTATRRTTPAWPAGT